MGLAIKTYLLVDPFGGRNGALLTQLAARNGHAELAFEDGRSVWHLLCEE